MRGDFNVQLQAAEDALAAVRTAIGLGDLDQLPIRHRLQFGDEGRHARADVALGQGLHRAGLVDQEQDVDGRDPRLGESLFQDGGERRFLGS